MSFRRFFFFSFSSFLSPQFRTTATAVTTTVDGGVGVGGGGGGGKWDRSYNFSTRMNNSLFLFVPFVPPLLSRPPPTYDPPHSSFPQSGTPPDGPRRTSKTPDGAGSRMPT